MGTFDRILGRRVMAGNLLPFILHRNRTLGNLDAALEGRVIGGHAVDYAPGAAEIVLTEALVPGVSHNIVEGHVAVLTCVMIGLHTLSDNCHFEIGATDAVDGGGNFTALMPHFDYHTGNVQSGFTTHPVNFNPYLIARYSAGHRSITFRVHANDATCEITCHWHGFYITE